MLEGTEVAKHSSKDSCWIVVHGHVYDVTEFLSSHPGGAKVLLKFGGRDATEDYESIHPPELIQETLPTSTHLGSVDPATLPKNEKKEERKKPIETTDNGPEFLINLNDFELAAEKVLIPSTWAYFSSAADDELSKKENNRAFQKVALRPRILRRVGTIDTRSKILGKPTSMPVFVSPCGLNKLAHPGGECAISSAAGEAGLIQVVSTGASMSIESIMDAKSNKDQPIFYQLYVNKDIQKSKDLIKRVEKAGVSAIWLTVDSPVLGKRERDDRAKAQEGGSDGGVAKSTTGWITSDLEWSDLEWIREATNLPLVIKGIQCVEDAIIAYEYGVQGIVLSNHGGRSQDTSQAPLLTLLEIRKYAPFLISSKMEIYLDGGVRRGTDVLKALALGATAVGLGRPFLHALAVGGEEGVKKMTGILKEEFRSNMALSGATKVNEIVPAMVNSKRLERELVGAVKL